MSKKLESARYLQVREKYLKYRYIYKTQEDRQATNELEKEIHLAGLFCHIQNYYSGASNKSE
jgi:hypothetical protein